MAISGCAIEFLTSLHPRSEAPVYVKLPAYRIHVGKAVHKHCANFIDTAGYIRSKRKCMTPPWQSIWDGQLDRSRGGNVVVLVFTVFILEAICQA
jgi:hypothetical protein